MPFHPAFTAGAQPRVLLSGDIQPVGLGHVTFPAGLRMQHCHQYMRMIYRLLKKDLKCGSLTIITHYDTLATQIEDIVVQASRSLGQIKKQNRRVLIFVLLLWSQIKVPPVTSGHKHRWESSTVSPAKCHTVICTCSLSLSTGMEIL